MSEPNTVGYNQTPSPDVPVTKQAQRNMIDECLSKFIQLTEFERDVIRRYDRILVIGGILSCQSAESLRRIWKKVVNGKAPDA